MRRPTHFLRALPMVLIAFAAMAMLPLSASAAPTSTTSRTSQQATYQSQHRAHFFKLLPKHRSQAVVPSYTSNLRYYGGPVQTGTTHVYTIFWEPTGNVTSTYNNLINRYFGDVGGSGLYNNNTQYTQSGGGHPSSTVLSGSWVDTSYYPSSTLYDSDIQSEVSYAQSVNGWSSGINNIFFVFTEDNEDICNGSSCASTAFCGYHSYFGSNTIYAAMPYAALYRASGSCIAQNGPNGDSIADAEISVSSHEQMEAATDPNLNAWYDSSGNEIGDKCAWNFGYVYPDGSNVNWYGDPYIVQKEWDNHISGCTLSGP